MSISARGMEALPMYIGGEWVGIGEPRILGLPYDGSPVGAFYAADSVVVEGAIEAARKGARAMRRLSNYERADAAEEMSEMKLICWKV